MQIRDLFKKKKPVISFEIFPPKKDLPLESIFKTLERISSLKPDYISITYGASGNIERNRTIEIAKIVKKNYNIEPLVHLTCITSTKDKIDNILNTLIYEGLKNILALRGDFPSDPDFYFPQPLHFEHALDLIREIKKRGKFSIAGACYPEGHIEARSKEEDILHLSEKTREGADFLISQLFFENSVFYDFSEKAEKAGINVPIEAGIMPVIKKKQIQRMVQLCGVSLPEKFVKILDKYENNPEALRDAGIAYASDQIIDLITSDVAGIHIYAMNNPSVVEKIYSNISSLL